MLRWVQQLLFPRTHGPGASARPAPPVAPRPARSAPPPARAAPARRARPARPSAQDRYDAIVRGMLAQHNVRVRRWRTSMSGVAFLMEYRDGTRARWIESPRPRSPLSLSIFLHEIGHHAIGLGAFKPRCLEEYHAWRFALETMEAQGVPVTDTVRRRMHRSLHYAVGKATRRGIQRIPPELEPFLADPPRRARRVKE